MIKNLLASAGDARAMEPGGWKDPLEAGMATHSKTLEAWQAIVNLMDRAAWQAIYSP